MFHLEATESFQLSATPRVGEPPLDFRVTQIFAQNR